MEARALTIIRGTRALVSLVGMGLTAKIVGFLKTNIYEQIFASIQLNVSFFLVSKQRNGPYYRTDNIIF